MKFITVNGKRVPVRAKPTAQHEWFRLHYKDAKGKWQEDPLTFYSRADAERGAEWKGAKEYKLVPHEPN
jgi:hypothetical protein